MYKIAAIGDKESIYGFASIGFEVHAVSEPKEAARLLKNMHENSYAIVYITEKIAGMISNEIEKYKQSVMPAIILIPGVSGNTGDGMKNVSKCVEQAVGSDIS